MKNIELQGLTKVEMVDVIYEITYQTNYSEFDRLNIDETLEEWELKTMLLNKINRAKNVFKRSAKLVFEYMIDHTLSSSNKLLLEKTSSLYLSRSI